MKILEINLPANPELGLKEVSLKRLGQIVILAGQNGAGKTRILKELVQYVSKDRLPGLRFSINQIATKLPQWAKGSNLKNFTHENVMQLIRSHVPIEFTSNFLSYWKSVRLSQIEEFNFVWLSPKNLDLSDVRAISPIDLERYAENARSSSIDELRSQVLARIQFLQNRWREARSQDANVTDEERKNAIDEYESLQTIVQKLLNMKFERNINGHASLKGKPIGEAGLSEGQRVLLLWSVMLHSQIKNLSQAIIICDEPENHLHPKALLDALDRIIEVLPEVQLWIATHSLPLLSHFDPSNIFWVEDGGIEFAGTKPIKILNGLIGDEKRIGRLHDFLGLPANLAANRFAVQCLLSPSVSEYSEGDPQNGQINNLLMSIENRQSLKILDFGAGRGRLAASFSEALKIQKVKIEYYALERNEKYWDELKQNIAKLHENENDRVFKDIKSLTGKHGLRMFDVVILCNVLHEIPIEKWLELFGDNGRFLDLLLPNGYLLIVEDTLLPVGENCHPGGFLVLDRSSLFEFFRCKPEQLICDIANNNPRLLAYLVPNDIVKQPTPDSMKLALQEIVKIANEDIDNLQEKVFDNNTDVDGNFHYRIGREQAFYVNQFTNAQRALKKIYGNYS